LTKLKEKDFENAVLTNEIKKRNEIIIRSKWAMDIFKEEVKDLTSKFDEVKFDHMREIETVKADERLKREKVKWMYEYKKRNTEVEQHKKAKQFKEKVVKAVFKLLEDLEKEKKEKNSKTKN